MKWIIFGCILFSLPWLTDVLLALNSAAERGAEHGYTTEERAALDSLIARVEAEEEQDWLTILHEACKRNGEC